MCHFTSYEGPGNPHCRYFLGGAANLSVETSVWYFLFTRCHSNLGGTCTSLETTPFPGEGGKKALSTLFVHARITVMSQISGKIGYLCKPPCSVTTEWCEPQACTKCWQIALVRVGVPQALRSLSERWKRSRKHTECLNEWIAI